MNDSINIDKRSSEVLYAVVESYIDSPEPVGSRFITKKYPIGFSPATIRNIMADLEEIGFLIQPHTSAGRIPTDKGYRYYVDHFLTQENLKEYIEQQDDLIDKVNKNLNFISGDTKAMCIETANMLSSMSNYISLVLLPKHQKATFNKINILKYKKNSIIAILLTDEGILKHNVIKTELDLSQDDLNKISDFFNSQYSGMTIDNIKNIIMNIVKEEKKIWNNIIIRAINVYEQAINFSEEDIIVSGLYDAIDLQDFSYISKIKELSKAIKNKSLMIQILDELTESDGITILIGEENSIEELKNLSIVAAPYKEGNKQIGIVALIGPTRMNYLKSVYIMDTVTKYVNTMFENSK